MSFQAQRLTAAVLALSAIFVGAWATLAPRSFFLFFPLPGHHWVAVLPPYNEHLVRDVGGLYLALLVLSVWSAVRPRRDTFAMTGLAWEAFSIPHLGYHAMHLDMFAAADVVGNLVALGGTVVLAGLLLVPARRAAGAAASRPPGGGSPVGPG